MGEDPALPGGVSDAAYANAVNRLRINFRVAVYTNVLATALLLAAAGTTITLLLVQQPAAAAVAAVVGALDVGWGVMERPWRQLLLANNRIALSDSLWVSYLESKDAIRKSELSGPDQLSQLLAAQSLWISRIGAIAQDDYDKAFAALDAINQRSDRLQSEFSGLAAIQASSVEAADLVAAPEGGTLDDIS
jgi:hypothetical protein